MASLVARTGETDEWQERQDNRDKRESVRERGRRRQISIQLKSDSLLMW